MLAGKRADFPDDTEPLVVPRARCLWVFSKLHIGSDMAPWSRCFFRTQFTEWESKGQSFDRAIEKPQAQNQYQSRDPHEGFRCWLQNPLYILWHWGSPPTVYHVLLISYLGPYLLGKRNCMHLCTYPITTQNTLGTMWGAQDRSIRRRLGLGLLMLESRTFRSQLATIS